MPRRQAGRFVGAALAAVALLMMMTSWRGAESTHEAVRQQSPLPMPISPQAPDAVQTTDAPTPPLAATVPPRRDENDAIARLSQALQSPRPTAAAARTTWSSSSWLRKPSVTNPGPTNCQTGQNLPLPDPGFYRRHPHFKELLAAHEHIRHRADALFGRALNTPKADEGPLLDELDALSLEYRAAALQHMVPNPHGLPEATWYHGMSGLLFNRSLRIDGVDDATLARNDLPRNLEHPAMPRRSAGQALDLYQTAMEGHTAAVLRALPAANVSAPRAVIDLGARTYNVSLSSGVDGRSSYTSSLRFMEEHVAGFAAADVIAFELDEQYAPTYDAFVRRRQEARSSSGPTGPFELVVAAAWSDKRGMVSVQSTMKSSADFCTASKKCACFPTVDFPAVLAKYPPRSVVLKMDIEGAEWVVLQAILQRGVADRIAALFLECHHYRSAQNVPEAHVTRDKWFTLPEYLKKGPKPTRVLRIQQWYAIVGLGMECYVAHDLMRRAGVATYEWP